MYGFRKVFQDAKSSTSDSDTTFAYMLIDRWANVHKIKWCFINKVREE